MLSNKFIDQLVSLSSELEGILLSDDDDIKSKVKKLNDIIATLKTDHTNLSETEISVLLSEFQQSIGDVEIATNHKLSILNFVQNISPK